MSEHVRRSMYRRLTVQFYVPDIAAGTAFYTRLLRRPPNFEPTPDFKEWDDVVPNVTFQLGEGRSIPTYPIRFRVDDIDAERERVRRQLDPPYLSPVSRIDGLVALCDLRDPWGNASGFYQVLFEDEPPTLTGSRIDTATELERILEGRAAAHRVRALTARAGARGETSEVLAGLHRPVAPGDRRLIPSGIVDCLAAPCTLQCVATFAAVTLNRRRPVNDLMTAVILKEGDVQPLARAGGVGERDLGRGLASRMQ